MKTTPPSDLQNIDIDQSTQKDEDPQSSRRMGI
jgi:hypothetical protein